MNLQIRMMNGNWKRLYNSKLQLPEGTIGSWQLVAILNSRMIYVCLRPLLLPANGLKALISRAKCFATHASTTSVRKDRIDMIAEWLNEGIEWKNDIR